MRSILFMLQKEFRQIFRTREMLAVIFVMPVIQMAVLGFAITNEVKHIKLIIADRDNSRSSREVVEKFSYTDRFDVVAHETDIQRIASLIHGWHAQMALVIPEGFQRDIQRQLKPDIQIIIDGLDGNSAGVALAYAQRILQEYGTELMTLPRQQALLLSRFQSGLTKDLAGETSYKNQAALNSGLMLQLPHTVSIEERMWYNLNLNSAQYMVPGIVALLLTIISMMLSSISLVREREIGTLEQLMVTPLKKHQLLLGKLIPFLILAFVEFFIVLIIAELIFNINMSGSYVLLGGMAFIFLFTTLGFGVLISTFASSQQQAFFISWFFLVFMIMMSGLFIPIENMPPFLQDLTYLNPLRYFMAIVRDIFQKGATLPYLLDEVIPMTLFGLLIITISIFKFEKRVR